jgi:hypothetical protein
MPILDQHTRCQISDLSEACVRYWELRGIAQENREEMQMELEQHFLQAAFDGKAPEIVVGSNPVAFAEAWAREMRPRIFRGGVSLLPGLVYALGVVSTTALFQQLLAHTPSFTFTLFTVYLLTSSGMVALLLPLEGFLAVRLRIRAERTVLLIAALVLVALVLREAGMRINWRMEVLSWGWPLTFLLLALAAVLFCLEVWRRTSQEQTPSDRRVKFGRLVMTLTGKVVLFDLFLGVSSIVVFNLCTLMGRVF